MFYTLFRLAKHGDLALAADLHDFSVTELYKWNTFHDTPHRYEHCYAANT
jgi:hypothetical protein